MASDGTFCLGMLQQEVQNTRQVAETDACMYTHTEVQF